MRIAVIGAAGIIGSGIVRDLLSDQSKGIEQVLVVGRKPRRVKQLASSLKDERAEDKVVDAKERIELSRILEGVEVCVNAAQYDVNLDVMEACLLARCHYVDLGGMFYTTLKQKKLHKRFAKRQVSAILGLGSAPGTTNILARYGADRLDAVEKVNLYDAIKCLGTESPIFFPPYSIPTLLEEYSADSMQFYNGRFRKMPALSGEEIVSFPQPFGEIECFHTLHSEPATLPHSLKSKGVKEVTWKLGQPDDIKRVARALVSVGFAHQNTLEVAGVKLNPRDLLVNLIQRNIEANRERLPKPKTLEESQPYEIIRAVVDGKKDGKKTKYTIDVMREPNEFYADIPDPSTSMPPSIGAQMLARGEIVPGVWAPEECVDCDKYFEEMKKRRFNISCKIEARL